VILVISDSSFEGLNLNWVLGKSFENRLLGVMCLLWPPSAPRKAPFASWVFEIWVKTEIRIFFGQKAFSGVFRKVTLVDYTHPCKCEDRGTWVYCWQFKGSSSDWETAVGTENRPFFEKAATPDSDLGSERKDILPQAKAPARNPYSCNGCWIARGKKLQLI